MIRGPRAEGGIEGPDEIRRRRQVGNVGETHQHHFHRLDRRGCRLNLFQPLQQHLPCPRERRQSELLGQRTGTLAIAFDRRIADVGLGRQLEAGQEMAEVEQILQHHQGVGAVLIKAVQSIERLGRGAAQHALQQFKDMTPVGDAEHVARRLFGDLAVGQGDRLIEQREAVAHRTVGGAGDQGQCCRFGLDCLGFDDPTVMLGEHLDRHAAQREALTARQDRQRNLLDFCRGKHEFGVRRRLFERLQQGIEGVAGEHVDFVDDVDPVPSQIGLAVEQSFGQLADVIDPGA